jgi:hypothetical protein
MTKAMTARPLIPLALTVTYHPVLPRFVMRPQLLTHRDPLPVGKGHPVGLPSFH